jgi:hypothetical protein
MTPNEGVANAPIITSRGVGPVTEATPGVPETDGEWGEPYGEWSEEISGSPPNEEGWDYMIVSSGTDINWGPGYGDWEYGITYDGFGNWEIIDVWRDGTGECEGIGVRGRAWNDISGSTTQFRNGPTESSENAPMGGTWTWGYRYNRTKTKAWNLDVFGDWTYYGDWIDCGVYCSWDDWIKPWCTPPHLMDERHQWRASKYHGYSSPLGYGYMDEYYWRCMSRTRYSNNSEWSAWEDVNNHGYLPFPPFAIETPYNVDELGIVSNWNVRFVQRGEQVIVQKQPTKYFHVVNTTYKKRTKTWIPGDNGTPEIPGSASVNAVSSVNTSFASFSVNSSGISLGGDGSHSHTINILTTATSNDAAHTHTVSASGIADIDVSGKTESGGAHSHTYSFKYKDLYLLDILGNPTTVKVPNAGETTVKNRKMRIWRRTA